MYPNLDYQKIPGALAQGLGCLTPQWHRLECDESRRQSYHLSQSLVVIYAFVTQIRMYTSVSGGGHWLQKVCIVGTQRQVLETVYNQN